VPANVGPKTSVLRGIGKLANLSRGAPDKVIEHVRLAGIVRDVVEERAELGAAEVGGGVGDQLDNGVDVVLGGHGGAECVESLAFLDELFVFGDVAGDFRGANDVAGGVVDGRDSD